MHNCTWRRPLTGTATVRLHQETNRAAKEQQRTTLDILKKDTRELEPDATHTNPPIPPFPSPATAVGQPIAAQPAAAQPAALASERDMATERTSPLKLREDQCELGATACPAALLQHIGTSNKCVGGLSYGCCRSSEAGGKQWMWIKGGCRGYFQCAEDTEAVRCNSARTKPMPNSVPNRTSTRRNRIVFIDTGRITAKTGV